MSNISSHSTSVRTSTEVRAIEMLGKGMPPVVVATTLGVTESRISQLMADEGIAEEIRTLRYERASKTNERDEKIDKVEDKLLAKLDDSLPMLMRPMEIARTLSMVNAMKRRGIASTENGAERSAIVTITMPKQITQNFTTNINNQVIQAGQQELLTIQSGSMDALISARNNTPKIPQGS
jgi:hypothetical protein